MSVGDETYYRYRKKKKSHYSSSLPEVWPFSKGKKKIKINILIVSLNHKTVENTFAKMKDN